MLVVIDGIEQYQGIPGWHVSQTLFRKNAPANCRGDVSLDAIPIGDLFDQCAEALLPSSRLPTHANA